MKKYFRITGWLEGVSLLTLFFIAMPIKYILHEPQAVRVVGMVHGLLFIAYVLLAFSLYAEENWPLKKLFIAILLSCLPFGTFIFEKKYL